MSHIDNKRRIISLSIGIFICIILIAISMVGSKVFELKDSLEEVKSYEGVKLEEYLDESIDIQFRLLNSIENSWNDYMLLNPKFNDPNTYIKKYVYTHISEMPNVIVRSAIMVIGENNDNIFTGYTDGKYYNIHDMIKNVDFKDNKLFVLDGDEEAPFGSGNRIYISRKTLKLPDGDFYVYVGFSEKIMYDGFVNSLDIQTVKQIDSTISNILWILAVFMIMCIVYGMYLVFFMTSFQEKVFYLNICKDMNNKEDKL